MAGHPARHSRRDPRRRRPGAHVHRRQHPRSVARQRNRGSGVRLLRARAVAVLGGAPRSRPGPPRRRRRPAGRVATSSSPAPPAVSAARRRSRWRHAVRRCSRWPATATRSTIWSPRSARPAARRTPSPATSPIRRRSTHTVKDILGRFGHVDYLVNNAGRSIRRSVDASTDRLHDYERVMAVNYFGAVRMVLALLPHWRERRFGHVVNVSSAGVQAEFAAVLGVSAEQGRAGRVRRRGRRPRRCRTTSPSPRSTCRWCAPR